MSLSFVVVEVNEGGAEDVDAASADSVSHYLGTSKYWKGAKAAFENTLWKPGMWMRYPCGWVFCVTDEVKGSS